VAYWPAVALTRPEHLEALMVPGDAPEFTLGEFVRRLRPP
jgi:hypothetical protein